MEVKEKGEMNEMRDDERLYVLLFSFKFQNSKKQVSIYFHNGAKRGFRLFVTSSNGGKGDVDRQKL